MTLETQLLVAARTLVARGWSPEHAAEDAAGRPVTPWSHDACRWSVGGALVAVWLHRSRAAELDLHAALAAAGDTLAAILHEEPSTWNRAPGRTAAEAVAALDAAVELSERHVVAA